MGRAASAAVAVVATVWGATIANAEEFGVSVASGEKKDVHTYISWKIKDCSSNTGVVKLLTKPQHGNAIPDEVDTIIGHSRFRATDPCIGKPMKGFRVSYQSDDGFHGVDTFTIEATYGKRRPVVDVYKVTVR